MLRDFRTKELDPSKCYKSWPGPNHEDHHLVYYGRSTFLSEPKDSELDTGDHSEVSQIGEWEREWEQEHSRGRTDI